MNSGKTKAVRGVLFDLDGTIVDTPYDWPKIRKELGAEGVPILSFIEGLSEPERSRRRKILEGHEASATRQAKLRAGIRPLLRLLAERGVRTALVTNNSRKNLEALLSRFALSFDYVSSRETGLWKPSGAPLRAAMKALGLNADECCVVGDSHFDVRSGGGAGIDRIFIVTREPEGYVSQRVQTFPSLLSVRRALTALTSERLFPNADLG